MDWNRLGKVMIWICTVVTVKKQERMLWRFR